MVPLVWCLGAGSCPAVSLAPKDHLTRLCDSVHPVSSQVQGQPMPMSCESNHCPTGKGRDGTGPSSRYEGRVFQPLHHCAQEKRWVTTNLGSAHLELGLS